MEHQAVKDRIADARRILEEARDAEALACGETAAALARLNSLQVLCKHPGIYSTSCMGDRGHYCPDCGYSN